jgi:hypothetical protein
VGGGGVGVGVGGRDVGEGGKGVGEAGTGVAVETGGGEEVDVPNPRPLTLSVLQAVRNRPIKKTKMNLKARATSIPGFLPRRS